MAEAVAYSSSITVFVNGKKRNVSASNLPRGPYTTLLQFLRAEGLTGTKLGCGEGGCGACTVMLSWAKEDESGERKIHHINANACLTPICALDGYHITTVEGIGGIRQGMHPVQQRIAAAHGSQCGFCTPGIVMSVYTILRNKPDATPHEIEESLDGNLCRCTGYRPILDAAKSLSKVKGCCGGGAGGGCPCFDGANGGSTETKADLAESKASENVVRNNTCKYANEQEDFETAMQEQGLSEPIFPPALMRHTPRPIRIEGENVVFYQPTSLENLTALKQQFPQARLVNGNTEVQIETKFKLLHYDTIINPTNVPELTQFHVLDDGVRVGGSVTLSDLSQHIDRIKGVEPYKLRGLVAIQHMLRWFASNQIRNVASIAGNVATASPISDMNPMLQGCGATIHLLSAEGRRDVPASDYFLSYRKTAAQEHEFIESITIPFTREFEFVMPVKQARRREDDISIVTGGLRVLLAPDATANNWRIEDIALSFGGMAPITKRAVQTEKLLLGKVWERASFDEALTSIVQELALPENVPGGQPEYRTALSASFLFKFFVRTSLQLQAVLLGMEGNNLPPAPVIAPTEQSAAESFITSDKVPTRGEQSYAVREGGLQHAHPVPHAPSDDTDRGPVGQPSMHKSAFLQTTGEALYVDDMAGPAGTLHAALVLSTVAHAKLLSIDASELEDMDGFEAFFCAKDVTGDNKIGAVVKDEEVFASDEIFHVGQVLGVVVATSHERAVELARLVKVETEPLPAVFTIEDAIREKSFFNIFHRIDDGDLKKEESESDVVVSGEVRMGGQEHFYLETNCTLVVPSDGGQLEVYASTQNPTKTQNFCAHVCGVPATHVVCRTKRLGGGFGGKETRSVFISCAAALAASKLQRPVKINIERDIDMCITGQRHPFIARYRAGATKDGRVKFLEADLYNNAGFSLDLSAAVMDRALFHSDNVYRWPAFSVRGFLCKTNLPSNTAFRGFGGPQGLMLVEQVMEHLAAEIGTDSLTFRQMNFYRDGDRTPFGQPIPGSQWHVPRAWDELLARCDFHRRREQVKKFNEENQFKKRGISMLPTKFGISFTAKFMNQGGALVHVYTDGTVLVSHGGTEMGQGLHTKVIQVVARAFGIPESQVHISETATDRVANAPPTAASMSTDLYGMAALDACEQILERLRPVAEKMPGADFASIVQAAYFARVNLSAQGFYAVPTERCGYDFDKQVTDNAERGNPFNYFTQGVACTEVEVDCLTGDCHIIRADVLMDLGSSINPAIDIGQIEGAFVQGYGWSTMEELVWGDAEHPWVRPGQLFTRGPGTYKIPAFNDVPRDFRVHLLSDNDNPFAVHSSKAVGEPPFFLGSTGFFAIREAIADARAANGHQGWYGLQSPATSERIRMAVADNIGRSVSQNNSNFQAKGSF